VRIDEEAIMNILLWYLPYAMFSGACEVVLAESGTRMASERRADSAERERRAVRDCTTRKDGAPGEVVSAADRFDAPSGESRFN
jgi:hypothetical protein